ncbi:hypothetical protein CEXT_135031 [Caerostris extrusa]|uniref:Uncharacterized protein n=1 Tax=Caerostris extrusa TaxID=172846 RepID=A0AAV4U838_CAEEX|nr:hypothetical protein CEXT_135031 [Caerostris extrusa]
MTTAETVALKSAHLSEMSLLEIHSVYQLLFSSQNFTLAGDLGGRRGGRWTEVGWTTRKADDNLEKHPCARGKGRTKTFKGEQNGIKGFF